MIRPDITPLDPINEQPVLGIIGMGSMGRMYAKHLSDAGWAKIHVCDQPSKFEALQLEYKETPGITVFQDGHGVSRSADWLMYSVEAEYIDGVVAQYGPSTKVGAIVAGQTSVKAPEKSAFENHLPADVHIVSCHSLHGPTVSPLGQPLVLIKHRAPDSALRLVESILLSFRSRYVYLSYEEHDLVTANTQAVTHAAFLSMGTAWAASYSYPWENGYYVRGIETVKVNIMLRIYSNQWHVYAGLALLNPAARPQIAQYARSATELFKLMLAGDEAGLRERVFAARDKVLGGENGEGHGRYPIFLSEDLLDRFSLGRSPVAKDEKDFPTGNPTSSSKGASNGPPLNSHLTILAMVDCWARLNIQPFLHLSLAATPIFRMWIGVAEYLFRSPERLNAAIQAAVHDVSHRSDDMEFVVATRGWSQCVDFGNFELYKERFTETQEFFSTRYDAAATLGSEMIKAIMESSAEAEGST